MKIKNLIWNDREAEAHGLGLLYHIKQNDDGTFQVYEHNSHEPISLPCGTEDLAASIAQSDFESRIKHWMEM